MGSFTIRYLFSTLKNINNIKPILVILSMSITKNLPYFLLRKGLYMTDNYKEVIKNYLCSDILKGLNDAGSIQDDRMLIKDGLLDSIGIMRLITFLGEKFNFELSEEDFKMENFETINDINKLVVMKSNKQ